MTTEQVNQQQVKGNKPKEPIEILRNVMAVQCQDGMWDQDEYMMGMANGLILAMAIMENTPNAPFKSAPKKWGAEPTQIITGGI